MARLKVSLLGGFKARVGVSPALVFPTKKARGLLAFLALYPGSSYTRELISGLLWSNSGDEQARASLRQTLSLLRKTFKGTGFRGLVTQADEIRLDSEQIEVDVPAFASAAIDGSPDAWKRAARLYRGELLAGFALRESAFQDWLAAERERIQGLALSAMTKLLAHYQSVGAADSAAQVAAQLLMIDKLQEDVHRTLMRLYLEQGRHGLALRQYHRCREALNQELGILPDRETNEIYQLIKASRHPHSGRIQDENLDKSGEPLQRASRHANYQPVRRVRQRDRAYTRPRLAVRPFLVMGAGSDHAQFADGLTEDFIAVLSKWRRFPIVCDLPRTCTRRSATVEDVAKWTGADYMLKGSVRRAGGRVRIAVQLVDTETGEHVWGERIDREGKDILAIQDEVARHIAATLQPELAWAEERRIVSRPDSSLGASDCFQRGLSFLWKQTPGDNVRAQELLSRAIELGFRSSEAFAALSSTYHKDVIHGDNDVRSAAIPRMQRAARRAVELDSNDAQAHKAMTIALLWSGQHEHALAACRRSIELNPDDTYSHLQLGSALDFMGHTSRAISSMETAIDLAPRATQRYWQWYRCALGYLHARKYEIAAAAAREAITSHPTHTHAYVVLAASLAHRGCVEEARDTLERGETMRSDFVEKWHEWPLYQLDEQKQHVIDGLRKAGWRGHRLV